MRALLHIGVPNAGGAAIREAIRLEAAALAAAGALAPSSPGAVDHAGLALYAGDLWRIDDARRAHGLSRLGDLRRWRSGFVGGFDVEIAASNAETALLSSDLLYRRLTTRREIARLRRFLAERFDPIDVVVYLRRQDRLALAMHAAASRFGARRGFTFPGPHRAGLYDFAARLRRWASVFGEERIAVRLFEPAQLVAGDVVADFANVAGLDALRPIGGRPTAAPTAAPPAFALEFLRRLNAHLPRFVDGVPNPERGDLAEVMEHLALSGPPLQASPGAADVFLKRFAAGNAWIARRFLDRADGRLFHDEGGGGEEGCFGPQTLDVDDAVRIAAALWAFQERRRR